MRSVRAGVRRAVLLAALAALAVLTSGCGLTHVADLNFRVDDRLHFTAPESRSTVHTPLTVSWRMDDFRPAALQSEPPTESAGVFAVFVDRAPIKPGQTLAAVADDSCRHTRGCPDLTYLRDQYVFVTRETQLTLNDVPKARGQRTGARHAHEATIVLVDARGGRIGENAYTVDFTIKDAG